MLRRIGAVVAIAAVGALLPVGVASADQTGDCRASASIPVYKGGRIHATASVNCNKAHADLKVRAWVVRDGSLKTPADKVCRGARTCSVTASEPNSAGNQKWCTVARAFNFGPGYARDEKCEYGDF
ncbi:hypothetical protein [Allokutzneria albata]|uniref:Secreted protein n=1 Tax=Allokutzneria albata TaxID=211114 RepID=A0A1G9RMD5_ALLAB|nr:hypothetical protein [Allokutzneria albata]SDM24416.1 hypothetical protein SAMN04489726_0558 [Allokutzneria albata]